MERISLPQDKLDVPLFQTGLGEYIRLSTLETLAKKQLTENNRVILDISVLGLIARWEGYLPGGKQYYVPSVILELIERSLRDLESGGKYIDITLKLLRKWGWKKIEPYKVMHMFFELMAMKRRGLLKPITLDIIPREYRALYFYCREKVYDKKFVIRFSPQVNILGEIIGATTAMGAAGIPILMTNLTYARLLAKYKLARAIVYLSNVRARKEEFILGKAEEIFHVNKKMIKDIKWIGSVLAFIDHSGIFSVILWLSDP